MDSNHLRFLDLYPFPDRSLRLPIPPPQIYWAAQPARAGTFVLEFLGFLKSTYLYSPPVACICFIGQDIYQYKQHSVPSDGNNP